MPDVPVDERSERQFKALDAAEIAYVVEPAIDSEDSWVAWVHGSPGTFRSGPDPETALHRLRTALDADTGGQGED